MAEILPAPWSEQQIEALETRQDDPHKYPYTCECGESLVPSVDGWSCDYCLYTQSWCLAADAEAKLKGGCCG